jgi:hypothetical protein
MITDTVDHIAVVADNTAVTVEPTERTAEAAVDGPAEGKVAAAHKLDLVVAVAVGTVELVAAERMVVPEAAAEHTVEAEAESRQLTHRQTTWCPQSRPTDLE